MDWLIGVLLLVSGALIGFFVAKQLLKKSALEISSETKQESSKQLFIQQAGVHLEGAFSVLTSIEKQCDDARLQLEHFQSQLKLYSQDDANQPDHYFGEQAAMYLRNAESGKAKVASTTTTQPRDYSGEASGLLQPDAAAKTD